MLNPDFKYTFEKAGLKLTATIPPYVFMYRHQGHSVAVDIKDERGTEARIETGLGLDVITEEQLIERIKAFQVLPSQCKTCKMTTLFRQSFYRSSDECETCAQARIKRDLQQFEEREYIKEVKEERKRYAAGYRFKTLAWVHPANGGDDYQIVVWSADKPSEAFVKSQLKRHNSLIFHDYVIKEIKL